MDRAAYASMFIYAAAANILPICLVKISGELSINLAQAGFLGFVTSIEQFFVLILSIFFAARFGKIRVIRAGLFVLSGGLLAFSFSGSYASAVSLILILGFGNAMLEALLTPLVEDLHPDDSGGKMNLLHSFWPVGVCVGVLIVGELLSRGLSWRWAFAGLAAAVLGISFLLPNSKRVNLPRSTARLGHLGEILSIPRFWMLGLALFFAGAAEFSYAYWSASYIQLHFGTMPRAGAVGAASFAVGMFFGRMISSRLAGRAGLKRLVTISLAAGFVFSLTFFLIRGPVLIYPYLFLMGVFIACLWPSIQSYAARVMTVDPTALMIFLSCFGIPGTSFSVLVLGLLGQRWGLYYAYAAAPVFLLLAFVFMFAEGRMGGKDE